MNTFKDKVAYRFAKTGFSVSRILIFFVDLKSTLFSMGARSTG
jgi:hypothetical protein